MTLASGTKLGPYEIVAVLGAGGMGEVYRARDPRLNRDVAIKVSSERFSDRFMREARTVAALNHPNLCTLFDVGPDYLVMELLEGETLRARLRQGKMPQRKAVDYARQLAQGLAAAHAAGVIHRDLKPENIMLIPSGRLKVLDFGLAKTAEGGAAFGDAETMGATAAAATAAGTVLGTVGYMAPEQVRGEPATAASDIFAFGAIVYEMLAGKRAFEAATSVEVMTAILREEPAEISVAGAPLPPALDRIVRRCLEKTPQQRFQSAADLDFALGAVSDAGSTSVSGAQAAIAATAKPRPRATRTPLAVAVAVAVTAAVCALFMLDRAAPAIVPDAYRVLSTHGYAMNHFPVWSPSGDAVAFAAAAEPGAPHQVYLYRLGSVAPIALTHVGVDSAPIAWSADARDLIFVEDQYVAPTLWSVAAVGGEPQKLLDLGRPVGGAQGLAVHGEAWAAVMPQPDGRLGVAYGTSWTGGVRWYAPAPFAAAALTDFPALAFSPDGSRLLLEMPESQGPLESWILPFPPKAGDSPQRVFSRLPPHDYIRMTWEPDGDHVLISGGMTAGDSGVWEATPGSGRLRLMAGGISSAYMAALSPAGNALALVKSYLNFDVVAADVRTAAVTPLVASAHKASMPAWAADASALVYVTDRDGQDEIWLHTETADGASERLLIGAAQMGAHGFYQNPSLSPHARRVAFNFTATASGTQPQPALLWLAAVSGGAAVPLTAPSTEYQTGAIWSPDGSQIAFLGTAGPTQRLEIVATTGGATPRVLVPAVASINQSNSVPAWSRDGKWIAFAGTDGLVHLIAPDGSGDHVLTRTPLMTWTFSADSKSLYGAVAHGQSAGLVSVSLANGAVTTIGSLGVNVPNSWLLPGIHMTLSPDGKSVTYNSGLSEDDVDLVQPFNPYGTGMAKLRHWLHLP